MYKRATYEFSQQLYARIYALTVVLTNLSTFLKIIVFICLELGCGFIWGHNPQNRKVQTNLVQL